MFGSVDKLVMITTEWGDVHHAELESKDLQIVIDEYHQKNYGNYQDSDIELMVIQNYHQYQEKDDRKSVEDAFDIEVGRDHFGLNSVNAVDSKDGQQQEKKLRH